jgi:hypothetical protein
MMGRGGGEAHGVADPKKVHVNIDQFFSKLIPIGEEHPRCKRFLLRVAL